MMTTGFVRTKQTIAATSSLRPRDFHRETYADQVYKEEKEQFLDNVLPIVKKGTFLQVHTTCQTDNEQLYKLRQDKVILEQEQKAEEERNLTRDMRRLQFMQHDKDVSLANTQRMNEIDKRWKKTQQEKKARQIRDLQFERAKEKVGELKQLESNKHHTGEGQEKVNEFEKIMKRGGIGADEDNGPMTINYENGEAFIERIERVAAQKWPTKEECSDFMNQLKTRTETNRASRYEKERRKRRANTNQDKNGGV